MRKLRIGLVVVTAAALAAALIVGPASAGTASTAGKKATVKLGDNFFQPANKKVKRKTLVRFKWIGNNPHNVVKTKGPGKNFASAVTSAKGINYKRKFKKKGTYTLVCTIHAGMDMKLKVK